MTPSPRSGHDHTALAVQYVFLHATWQKIYTTPVSKSSVSLSSVDCVPLYGFHQPTTLTTFCTASELSSRRDWHLRIEYQQLNSPWWSQPRHGFGEITFLEKCNNISILLPRRDENIAKADFLPASFTAFKSAMTEQNDVDKQITQEDRQTRGWKPRVETKR